MNHNSARPLKAPGPASLSPGIPAAQHLVAESPLQEAVLSLLSSAPQSGIAGDESGDESSGSSSSEDLEVLEQPKKPTRRIPRTSVLTSLPEITCSQPKQLFAKHREAYVKDPTHPIFNTLVRGFVSAPEVVLSKRERVHLRKTPLAAVLPVEVITPARRSLRGTTPPPSPTPSPSRTARRPASRNQSTPQPTGDHALLQSMLSLKPTYHGYQASERTLSCRIPPF
eukprot:TRINITY_DN3744_c0_g1_i2.p1 TRINITY_DN3744_c0_g1~~TRINITY_DN3744_c0_g1_i2.p1  ORF type:complete len:226 (+),score=26.95 TRINITY_DN3744_c0_g1_i2:37-714(+)